MNVKILEEGEKKLVVRIDNETIASLVVSKLLNKAEFAGYNEEHPLKNNFDIIIIDDKPRKKLEEAIKELIKELNELEKQI